MEFSGDLAQTIRHDSVRETRRIADTKTNDRIRGLKTRQRKPYVELNRYAVGAGEWIGVGPRLVSCESDPLAGSGYID